MPGLAAVEIAFAVLDHLPIGAFVLRKEHSVVYWNRRLEEWTGIRRESILERTIDGVFSHFAAPKYADRLQQVFDSGAPVVFSSQLHQHIIPSRLPNGEPRIQHTTVTAVPADEGGYYALFSLQDVSDMSGRLSEYWRLRDRAQEKLRQSERLASIGTLAAGIAHEINNPLAIIAMNTTAALRCASKPNSLERTTQYLREIQEENQRCARIVESVLQFAQQDGREKSPHELVAIARRAVDAVRRQCRPRHPRIHVCTITPEVWGIVNPTQIEQALVNLLGNAVEASQPGDAVSLRVESEGSQVRLVVADGGRGMTGEQLKHMFDPFYSTHHEENGLGLGLSLVHGIVNQHGGVIDVDSRLGKGTTVTVKLPKEVSAPAGAP